MQSSGPDVLVIAAKPGYNSVADECETPEALARIEQALQRLLHRPVTVRYERSAEAKTLATDGTAARPVRQTPWRPTRWSKEWSSSSRHVRIDRL